MPIRLALLGLLLASLVAAQSPETPKPDTVQEEDVCVLETSMGTMVLRFHDKEAPQTVANFKQLVREGFYDGKTFYRVVKGHVIQTGDGGENDRPKVPGEFSTIPHVAGEVGLARDTDPNSGSTEIYICLAPRPHLDGKYALFGRLIEGMDVLEKIGDVPVDEQFIGTVAFHKPKEPVTIRRAFLEKRRLPAP